MTEETDWEGFKTAWAAGQSPAMSESSFMALFSDGTRAKEALELIRASSAARSTLENVCRIPILANKTSWYSGQTDVWEAVQTREMINHILKSGYRGFEGVLTRCGAIAYATNFAVRQFGRKWVRENLNHWWSNGQFEEEEETLLRALAQNDVLDAAVVHELGPKALEVLQRLVLRGELRPGKITGVRLTEPVRVQGSQPGNPLALRVAALMQPVVLPVDIGNACLRPDEAALEPDDLGPLLIHGLQRLRDPGYAGMDEIAEAVGQILSRYSNRLSVDSAVATLRFPLIRYLHLALLLDAPALSAALPSPEKFVPQVLYVALGDESVKYSPELSVSRDTDSRWRARWAESSGEAISIIFLESTVGLDLSTLTRIPEATEETPDFKVQTASREPIVFECKGATSWKVHRDQRNKARSQLYGTRVKAKKPTTSTWAGVGRAFALCLFAPRSGSERKSLFYAEDPPFPFVDLFSEGWEDHARRTHYTGVLEAAQMYEAADSLRAGRGASEERRKTEFFSVSPVDSTEDYLDRYVGTYLPVEDVARRLRHPSLSAASQVRIFVGVHEQILSALRRNELPAFDMRADSDGVRPNVPRFGGQAWGYLPGRERGSPARGVFSTLADGSFLAVELQ